MKTICRWKCLADVDRGAAVALGSFDGVYRCDQRLIAETARAAEALGAPLGLVIFDPGADMDLQPRSLSRRVMNRTQLARRAEALGVDLLYLLSLDCEMANFSGRDFVKEVLVAGLGVRHVTLGSSHTLLALSRADALGVLRRYGEDFGFSVGDASEPGGSKDSSTATRRALHLGRPDQAALLMGRPFAIEGVVQRGRQLGRQLGFPTANVPLGDYVLPKFGVYATRTRLEDGREVPGVANIGVNPTTGAVAPILEVWLFDFDENIYGQTIETELVAFQRPEIKFPSIEAMVEQLWRDALQARRLLQADA